MPGQNVAIAPEKTYMSCVGYASLRLRVHRDRLEFIRVSRNGIDRSVKAQARFYDLRGVEAEILAEPRPR